MDDDGFYFAQLMNGENGMVPSNFVEKVDEGEEEGEVVQEGERQEREGGERGGRKRRGREGERKWWEIHVGGGKKREVREGEVRMIECVVIYSILSFTIHNLSH